MDGLAAQHGPSAATEQVRVLTHGLPVDADRIVSSALARLDLAREAVNDFAPLRFDTRSRPTLLIAGTSSLSNSLERTPGFLPSITTMIPTLGIGLPANVGEGIRLMKAGVRHLVKESIETDEFESLLRESLRFASTSLAMSSDLEAARRRLSNLSDQEFDVFALLMAGMNNKEIADRLHLGLRTVEGRRHDIMGKTRTRSFAELVRLGVKVAYPWVV